MFLVTNEYLKFFGNQGNNWDNIEERGKYMVIILSRIESLGGNPEYFFQILLIILKILREVSKVDTL